MSKGAIRFPASAIAAGRVGTARIRDEIAGASARLASTDAPPLDAALVRLTGGNAHTQASLALLHAARGVAAGLGLSVDRVVRDLLHAPSYSPIERMRQLGRLPRGKKNKTEAAYELEVLEPQLHAGEILWYRFEAIKLRLADNTFLTVDFPVITATGELEFREVKGRWTDDARAKIKIAAAQFPWRFYAIHRVGRHGWRTEDLTSRSW